MLRIIVTFCLALFMSCNGSNGGGVDVGGEEKAGDGDGDGNGYDYDDGADEMGDDGGDDGGGDGDSQGDDATAILNLSSINPTQGGASVPTPVSLSGTGFTDGIEVYVGGVPATDITVVSSVEVTATFQPVEPLECGKKDVRVVQGGDESTLTEAFEYIFDEDPVVFVHGYLMNSSEWNTMIQAFKDRGYPEDRLFAIDYTNSLDSHITNARDELAPFVDSVLAQTGADRVDLVGHSSGGVSSRLLIAVFGGQDEVRDFVSVSGTHHGTQIACLGTWTGEAAEEMCPPYASEAESHNNMQWMLNGDPDTDDIDETPFGVEDGGAIAYSALWTEDDLIDVPPHTCCLNQTFRGDCGDPINVMFSGIGHIEMSSHADVVDKVFDLVRVHNISKP
jgi:pimeloyl-ACP methyl ester carboxylesterase